MQQFVTKDEDILEVGGEMSSNGQLLQNGLNGEQHGGEVAAEIPPRKPLPFKRGVKRSNIKKATSPAPEKAAATPRPGETIQPDESQAAKPPCPVQSPQEQSKGENTPADAPVTSKDFQCHSEDPAKEGNEMRRKHPENSGKEKVVTKNQAEPQIKGETKKEQGEIKEKPVAIKEEPVEFKEEPVEIQEESVEIKKEPGEMKEPGESTDSDKVILCPVRLSCCFAGVCSIESCPMELE